MKNTKLLLALASGIFLANMATAASPFEKYLMKTQFLDETKDRVINTYEDISDINLNPFHEGDKEFPIVAESEIPEGYVKKGTANKFFKNFYSHAIITEEPITYPDFFNEHVSLECGGETYSQFPISIDDSLNEPGAMAFNLRVDDNYKYVLSFKEFAPDALSCHVAPQLCSEKCKIKTIKTKSEERVRHRYYKFTDDGSNGYDYYRYDSQDDSPKTETKKVHAFGPNNIYSDFRQNLLSKANIENAEEIKKDNFLVFKLEDRTPPYIVGGYIKLGGNIDDYACTSGDYYRTEGMEIRDNNPSIKEVSGKFAFGRLSGQFPVESEPWENYEDWSFQENIKNVVLGDQIVYHNLGKDKVINGFEDVVKFHDFDGVIRYSVFLKENSDSGNLNPGMNNVLQDRPEVGYGYKPAGDLGSSVLAAKPWPDKRDLDGIKEKGYSTGFVRIYDNDRPNVAIRITEVETGKQMFFPPMIPAGQFKVNNSNKYKAEAGINKTNTDDYDLFVKDLSNEFDYTKLSAYPEGIPYYTILSLNDQNLGLGSDTLPLAVRKMLNNNDVNFINQNVRLEDYYISDTLPSGEVTYSYKNDELGRKRGTMRSMVALFENSSLFNIKEDVEYRLDVWTDDNVKWTNIKHPASDEEIVDLTNPEVLDYAKIYETGIKEGVIRINIPEYNGENLNQEKEIDISKSINGGMNFVLKERTPAIRNIDSVELAEKNNFPSITVSVKDFAGYNREIKLFFRVGDKKLNMRVLEPDK